MRSVRSTPLCPSASSPVRPGAERATTKVSCTCVGHVSMCIQYTRVHLHTASGERDDTCERYSSVPECFKPCPAKCEQSFRDQVTTSSWCSAPVLMPHYPRWRTRSARGSPPPPRCPTATTPPAPRSAWTRPRTTSVPDRWHGHTLATGHHNLMTLVFPVSEVQG